MSGSKLVNLQTPVNKRTKRSSKRDPWRSNPQKRPSSNEPLFGTSTTRGTECAVREREEGRGGGCRDGALTNQLQHTYGVLKTVTVRRREKGKNSRFTQTDEEPHGEQVIYLTAAFSIGIQWLGATVFMLKCWPCDGSVVVGRWFHGCVPSLTAVRSVLAPWPPIFCRSVLCRDYTYYLLYYCTEIVILYSSLYFEYILQDATTSS